ncbi:MAG: FAD-dependent oxidoreductase [Gammaproteobacteria bacterium]
MVSVMILHCNDNSKMKSQAEIVIIGGGVMGCSLAYHLCKEGKTDVLLLEKGELTGGSTWHAAGQITHSVSHYALAKMAAYGAKLYPALQRETGQACGWHGCGSLRIAYEHAEVDWLKHTISVGAGLGHRMEMIPPSEIARLHPFYRLHGVKAALHTPEDGHADPAGISLAMAKGARGMGCEIIRHNRARGIRMAAGGEFVVDTEQGEVRAHTLVNAGGVFARQIGAWLGLNLPIANLLHHYLITENVPEFAALRRELPVVRDDREVSGYIRMEQQSGLIGIYEKTGAVTVWDDGAPWESENELFEADFERIMPWLENAHARMPVLAKLGIKRVVRGAITHPPDGNMLLGPTARANFWLCCGAQVGIAWGAGAGKYLAQWMTHGAADISMRSFDPRRFGARLDRPYRLEKAKEDYSLRHEIPFPNRDRRACRPSHSKTSPLFEPLLRRGAVYEEVFGWERPAWFAPRGVARAHIHAFRRTRLHQIVGEEVTQLRANAGLADLSAFAKIEIHGRDAAAFLRRVSSNRLPRLRGDAGGIALTYFILENGRIEGEASVVRLGENHFYLVYAAVREAALLGWLRAQLRGGEHVRIDNVSEKFGVLLLAGPNARTILAGCTDAALDNAAFAWLTARTIRIGGAENIRALRITYSGELGWELHTPMRHMREVYQTLAGGARAKEIAHIGSYALNAMRMEKGYLSGAEITGEVTLAEAGLLRFARDGDFQGKARSLAAPKKWLRVCLELDEGGADPLGAEAVYARGAVVGRISSGGFGYARGRYLAHAYINARAATRQTPLEVSVLGAPRAARMVAQPLRDPHNKLPRADA